MSKKIDKRVFFVKQALIRGLTNNVLLANEWYCQNRGWSMDTEECIRRFEQFIGSLVVAQ